MAQSDTGDTPNDASVYEVTWADLPLSCPLPRMSLWCSHPRVYLPIHRTGRVQCPYCGAVYVLAAPTPGEDKPFLRGDAGMESEFHAAVEAVRQGKNPSGAPSPPEDGRGTRWRRLG